MLIITVSLSTLIFSLTNLFQDNIINYFSNDIDPVGRKTFLTYFNITKYLILFQPIYLLIGNIATGLKLYGSNPISNSIIKIVALVSIVFIPIFGAEIYPLGLVIGSIIASFFLIIFFKKKSIGFNLKPSYCKNEMNETLKITFPWIIISPILNMPKWFLVPLILGLGPGSYASYGYAVTLNTMLISAFLVPLVDSFSPILAENSKNSFEINSPNIRDYTAKLGIRISIITGTFISMLGIALAKPIVGIVLFHGKFNLNSANEVADLLALMGLMPIGRSVLLFSVRFFQSRVSPWSQVKAQIIDPIITILICLIFINHLGIMSMGIALTLGTTFASILALKLLWNKIKSLEDTINYKLIVWIILSSILSYIHFYFFTKIHINIYFNILTLVISSLIIVSSGLALGKVFRIKEIDTIINIAFSKLNKIK